MARSRSSNTTSSYRSSVTSYRGPRDLDYSKYTVVRPSLAAAGRRMVVTYPTAPRTVTIGPRESRKGSARPSSFKPYSAAGALSSRPLTLSGAKPRTLKVCRCHSERSSAQNAASRRFFSNNGSRRAGGGNARREREHVCKC